ncbi:MAG: methyltransferase domain-containing protein [Candidatus Omnitrophica bacterium]|nr:methyltransferase domain-containing protein [Candidatus Omnitrophota bacterium]
MNFQCKIKKFIKRGGFWTIPNERTFLYRVLSDFSSKQKDKRILDVGAGVCQYRPLIAAQNSYESCDLEDGFHLNTKHDFLASVYSIPKKDRYYDGVLMLQVLEHLEFPLKGLKEVNRILKDNGFLFLSVPQAAGDHFEPYHFFNYTQFGLKSVFEQSGFQIKEHHRLAGMFTYVGNRLEKLGSTVFSQYKKNYLAVVPAWVFSKLCWVAGWFVCRFDFIDREKKYCIGHIVIATKIKHLG